MARLAHGAVPTPEQVADAQNDLASRTAEVDLGFAVTGPAALQDFDFLFPTLQNNQANLLPQAAATPARLKELGRTMVDPGAATGDSTIPAIYTYFGQFVDHDITLESGSAPLPSCCPQAWCPCRLATIRNASRTCARPPSTWTACTDPPPPGPSANLNKMLLGRVTSLGGTEKPSLRPAGKGDDNDLPARAPQPRLRPRPRRPDRRSPQRREPDHRPAAPGVPQGPQPPRRPGPHLRPGAAGAAPALPAHRDPRLPQAGRRPGDRRRHPGQRQPASTTPPAEPFFLPLEFTVAAYRFGHTMIRDDYDFNLNFNRSGDPGSFPADLALLFTFTALSGELGDFDTLPDNWIIEWENFVDAGTGPANRARKIDTKLAERRCSSSAA